MSAPRVLDDGAKVGYGLLLFISISSAIALGTAVDIAAVLWKRWRRL